VPKTKKIDDHQVPLSNGAIGILQKMKCDGERSDVVFPGATVGEPLSDGSMLRVLDRMGCAFH
jgi:hypothetical protein